MNSFSIFRSLKRILLNNVKDHLLFWIYVFFSNHVLLKYMKAADEIVKYTFFFLLENSLFLKKIRLLRSDLTIQSCRQDMNTAVNKYRR